MFSSMLSLLGSLRGGSSFITNSLRFRSSASAYLSRTPAAAGSRTTWTWSGWVKRGTLGSAQFLMSTLNTQEGRFGFAADDSFTITAFGSPGEGYYAASNAKFRDTSAWYHIVVVYDSTNATPALRQRVYVNNSELTWASPSLITTSGLQGAINSATAHSIARYVNGTAYFDGYLADVNFIDGQALTPASFGAIDSSTGVWAPSRYSGTYGTNGFYLKFANTSSVAALGNDSSGNNNTWTVNNVSLTAGATYDSTIDVPVNYADGGNGRGNYAVLNPVFALNGFSAGTITDGNLKFLSSTTYHFTPSTIQLPSSGKWYAEFTPQDTSGLIGVVDLNNSSGASQNLGSGYGWYTSVIYTGNAVAVQSGLSAWAANDIIGVAVDMSLPQIQWYKNNTLIATQSINATTQYAIGCGDYNSIASATIIANFGQRPFAYTPPAGFRALNTNNLPTPSIVNGANFMAATTYTGNAAARSLSNAVNSVSFQPDLVWIKSRTPGATNHALFDSVRGTTKYLSSNTTTGETTLAQSLTAFGADGFSLGTDTTLVNANANSYVAWQWKESVAAGLDVVTYTGTGAVQNINHSLGIAPAMVIVKNRTGSLRQWTVYHKSIPNSQNGGIYLNLTNSWNSDVTLFNNTAPTSSQFTVGTYYSALGETLVAYCFAEIAGFSRFGSYTGNGSADGPFVFCGFRPRWVMVKNTITANTPWLMYDTSRDSNNPETALILANVPNAETLTIFCDMLSNGFKVRQTGSSFNSSGETFIFAAFAENPSKYALAR